MANLSSIILIKSTKQRENPAYLHRSPANLPVGKVGKERTKGECHGGGNQSCRRMIWQQILPEIPPGSVHSDREGTLQNGLVWRGRLNQRKYSMATSETALTIGRAYRPPRE